eukprot:TRINITY_DN45097_c0_g1_i1.p2 TRINITY_DN45097_c0_g1~~TRINITY_DN45097_c0_g1_i1.p2  ORF type:complete len:297 (+),score=46.63 TRINITY_DN45097_c0_g1_i1:84-893(+)
MPTDPTLEEVKKIVRDGTPADVLALLQDERLTAAHFNGVAGEPRPKDSSEWFCQVWRKPEENILNDMMSRFVSNSGNEGESASDQVAILEALLRHSLMTADVFNNPSRVYGNHNMPYPALLCACEYSLWHLYDVLVASPLLSAEHAATTWVDPRELSTQSVLLNLILRLDDSDNASRDRASSFLARGLVRWDYINAPVTHYNWRGSFLELAAKRNKPQMLMALLGCNLLVQPCFKDFAVSFVAHAEWLQSPEGARERVADAIAAHAFSS